MSRPQFHVPGLVAILVIGASALARADVVTLKDGRKVEGAIVERSSLAVIVRQKLGEVRLEQAQIADITEQDDPWDQLQRLRVELGGGTADERYRLAAFAAEQGFEDEARRAYLAVLRVDPDHPGARAALGFVKLEGRWITRADKARADGLVEHRGQFVTPEEKARLEAEARAEADKKKAAREAAVTDARAKREAEQEEERRARRARIAAYDQELARARARERASSEYGSYGYGYGGNGILSTFNGFYGYPYGPVGVVVPRWNGLCPPRNSTYCQPGLGFGGGRRYGVSSSGSYNGGNWGVRWRVGF